jgi:hypothetical protein
MISCPVSGTWGLSFLTTKKVSMDLVQYWRAAKTICEYLYNTVFPCPYLRLLVRNRRHRWSSWRWHWCSWCKLFALDAFLLVSHVPIPRVWRISQLVLAIESTKGRERAHFIATVVDEVTLNFVIKIIGTKFTLELRPTRLLKFIPRCAVDLIQRLTRIERFIQQSLEVEESRAQRTIVGCRFSAITKRVAFLIDQLRDFCDCLGGYLRINGWLHSFCQFLDTTKGCVSPVIFPIVVTMCARFKIVLRRKRKAPAVRFAHNTISKWTVLPIHRNCFDRTHPSACR